MQISKDSWHFKLNDTMQTSFKVDILLEKPFTTCSYIRLTIFSMLLALMFIVVGVAVACLAMALLFGMIGAPIAIIMALKFDSAIILHVLGLGMIGWVVAIFGGLAFGLVSLVNWIGETNTKRQHKKEEKASLMKQAMKDRKDGICTFVTFK